MRLTESQTMHRPGRNGMATTVDPLKPRSAIHHHETQAAGIGKFALLLQHGPWKQRSSFATSRRNDVRDEILFRQLVTATEDLLKTIPATGTLDH